MGRYNNLKQVYKITRSDPRYIGLHFSYTTGIQVEYFSGRFVLAPKHDSFVAPIFAFKQLFDVERFLREEQKSSFLHKQIVVWLADTSETLPTPEKIAVYSEDSPWFWMKQDLEYLDGSTKSVQIKDPPPGTILCRDLRLVQQLQVWRAENGMWKGQNNESL